jgi:murein DD-endopeptidase MepM/ murein hydrolase activator NlpD
VCIDTIIAIVDRARVAAADGRKDGETSGAERQRLKQIAAEFESMLLVQMLKDMRKAGQWSDSEEEPDSLGAESMFETIDVELASHLARVKGLGLQTQLLEAFSRTEKPKIEPGSISGALPAGILREIAPHLPGPGVSKIEPGLNFAAPGAPTTESTPVAQTSGANFTDSHDKTAHNVRPVHGEVTSAFGWRRDPFTHKMKFHQGVDLRAAYGQEVQAASKGIVVFSGDQGGYGTSVVVEHQDGTRTRYAHLSASVVRKGDQVGAGEPVGRAGRSGRATGTHLHFEVIGRDGRRVEPHQWASADTAGRALPPGMDEHKPGGSGD